MERQVHQVFAERDAGVPSRCLCGEAPVSLQTERVASARVTEMRSNSWNV